MIRLIKWVFWDDTLDSVSAFGFVLSIVAIVIIITVLMYSGGTFNPRPANPDPCHTANDSSFACRDYQVNQCLASDKYNKEQCIALVGGK